MPKPYNTEENRLKGQVYRAKHGESYRTYQNEYRNKNKTNPTILLSRIRSSLAKAKASVTRYEIMIEELLIEQANQKAARNAEQKLKFLEDLEATQFLTAGDWLRKQED